MKNFLFIFLFALFASSSLFAQTISGPSSITLDSSNTYTLSAAGIPSGYIGILRVEWRKNGTIFDTKTCSSANFNGNLVVTTNECSFSIDALVTYRDSICTAPRNTISWFSNSIFVTTNCLSQPSVTANGSVVSGSSLNVPCGCTTPITFGASASNASGFSWTGPAGWTPAGAFGSTYTVTPNATGAGTVSVTASGPCCGITTNKTISIVRTRPGTSFVSPVVDLCTPATAQNYSIANTLGSLCGATNFTYSLTGSTSPTFTANGLQSLTTTASNVQVNFPAGTYTVNLNVVVNYACGASSTSFVTIRLYNGAPPTPTLVQADRIGFSCYYDARTPKNVNANKYYFSINGGPYYLGNILSGYAYAGEMFLGPSTEVVKVYAQNPCNSSGIYTKNLSIPTPSGNCMLMPGTDNTDPIVEAGEREQDAEKVAENFEFRFYPVPAEDYLYIESKAQSTYRLNILNVEGKIVRNDIQIQSGTNEVRLDLPSGMYLLNLTGENSHYQTKIYVKAEH